MLDYTHFSDTVDSNDSNSKGVCEQQESPSVCYPKEANSSHDQNNDKRT